MPLTIEDVETPALLFDTVERHGTTYWEARAIVLRGAIRSAVVRNPDSNSGIDGLQAYTFGITDTDGSNRQTVHYYVEYRDTYSVNVYQAERMFKTLTKVTRVLEKTAEQDGMPATFGQYVVRVAKALGMRYIVLRANGRLFASSYDEQKFNTVSLAEGQAIIDHAVNMWLSGERGEQTAA